MRIAVIGAGIGGLVAAAGLQRGGHDVTLYEQRRNPDAVGAGLTLFGNALDALDAIGLGDVVRQVSSGAVGSMRSGQRTPAGRWTVTVSKQAVASLRSTHRGQLHRALLETLDEDMVHAGQQALVAADGSPEITVDGRVERFDLVVVADGIRSRNRQRLGLDDGLRYAGYTAWRGVTATPVDVHGEAGETWGRGRRFGIVPLPDGKAYWFATLSTPAGTEFGSEHEAVRTGFAGWHAPIAACVEATPPADVLRHDVYDLAAIPSTFVRDRTVLLGDAAHAMTPDLGQGAGQAIEDAVTLTLLLDGVRSAGQADRRLATLLARYDDLRRGRTTRMWRRSRLAGRVAQLAHPVGARLRDVALTLVPGALVGSATKTLRTWTNPTLPPPGAA